MRFRVALTGDGNGCTDGLCPQVAAALAEFGKTGGQCAGGAGENAALRAAAAKGLPDRQNTSLPPTVAASMGLPGFWATPAKIPTGWEPRANQSPTGALVAA